MDLKTQNVLFIVRTMGIGGTENVVLQLCEILSDHVKRIIVCSAGGVHETELMDLGVKHYKIPDIASKNPLDMIRIYRILRAVIKKERVTLIHSHHRMAALYAEMTAPKTVIKIANAHNTFWNRRKLTRFSYRNTKLIAVGEMVKKNLVDYFGVCGRQIQVIYNAVLPFSGEKEPVEDIENARRSGCTMIGNIGRLSEQKGMSYFIEAAWRVRKVCPQTRFFIVGEGEDRKELEDQVRSRGMEKDIVFMGYRSDVQNVIAQMDFVVLSSLWEGLPLIPIEAFSVGKTIVATAVDGTPEIVRDGENGYLVPPGDAAALADRIEKLILNPEEREKLEKNARNRYEEQFSFSRLRKEYLDFYSGLHSVGE